MSEAKVLSAKQQLKTVSNAKKKKKKVPVRNVYGHPREENWPVLSSEDERFILKHMQKLFSQKAGKVATKIKGTTVKSMASSSNETIATSQKIGTFSNQLVIGLCEVIVEIERRNLKCLLLANEVDPPSLGHLIGNMATAHNIPFVAVSNLKSSLEELLGFKSLCVGFKASSKDFDLICDRVRSVTHNLEKVQSQPEISLSIEVAEQINNTCKSAKRVNNISDLYLYRTDRSKRVFVPETGASHNNSVSSFLPFSKDSVGDKVHHSVMPTKSENKSKITAKSNLGSSKVRYFDKIQLLPLQVKRFQENPNKQKWKKSKKRF